MGRSTQLFTVVSKQCYSSFKLSKRGDVAQPSHIPGVSPAAQSTILPNGDRSFDLDGGRDGAVGPYESGGGVTPCKTSLLLIDSIWKAVRS